MRDKGEQWLLHRPLAARLRPRDNRIVVGPADQDHVTVAAVWSQQSLWSQAADRLKSTIDRARTAALLLGIVSAVFGTAASQAMAVDSTWGKTLAFGAAFAAGLVPPTVRHTSPAAIRNWTRLRSMSEALKSEVYVCLAGVTPYRGGGEQQTLFERVEQLRHEVMDLVPNTFGIAPVARTPPAVTDVASYIDLRLRRQITDYYRPKALEAGRRARTVRHVEVGLGTLGAALGAASGAFGVAEAAAWIAVTTTVGAAVGAHGVAAKYAYQETEFARTAEELQRLLNRRCADAETAAAGEAERRRADDAFVTRCEDVISVLNDSWMTKWTTE